MSLFYAEKGPKRGRGMGPLRRGMTHWLSFGEGHSTSLHLLMGSAHHLSKMKIPV